MKVEIGMPVEVKGRPPGKIKEIYKELVIVEFADEGFCYDDIRIHAEPPDDAPSSDPED
jgi:hypothetical protein